MVKNLIHFVYAFILVIAIYVPETARGQEYKVAEFGIDVMDLTARTKPRVDVNGRKCAVLKVLAGDKIVGAKGSVIGDIESLGMEKLIYVPHDTKQIQLNFENHYPLRLIFDDYGYPTVSEQMVYIVKLDDGKSQAPSGTTNNMSRNTDDGETEFKRAHKYFDEGNYESTVMWLEIAATKEHPFATSDLGLMYEYGIGVKRNLEIAMEYYSKALSLGYSTAAHFAKRVQQGMVFWKDRKVSYPEYVIYFDPSHKSNLTISRENKLVLKYIAEIMKANDDTYYITGIYRDEEYEGNSRSRTVKDYLTSLGVKSEKIISENAKKWLFTQEIKPECPCIDFAVLIKQDGQLMITPRIMMKMDDGSFCR